LKILYIGGQKSGKSLLAEKKALEIANKKPYYIATYDNSFGDEEMQRRIDLHKSQRGDSFVTLEEPIFLDRVIKDGETYLVDCMSMWILNLMNKKMNYQTILTSILKKEANIIFVLNEVGLGIIPHDSFTREYVDISGRVGQELAKGCDEVYQVVVGLGNRLK